MDVTPGPLPHLLHISKIQGDDWVNPAYDTSSATWSSQVVGGSTYEGSDAHPFEWVSVLNPAVEQDDEVGVAGFAVGVDLSGHDLPFTHPFGGDFEFGIAPDAQYAGLLAPSNHDPNSDNDNIKNAFPDGRRIGLPVTGALPMEVEAGIVPDAYRAQVGDRVAAYGRWIVDAGHKDFHSEIHPPLLLARARAVNSQDADAYPDPGAVTLLQLWSRPYQAAQKFTDGNSKNLSLQSYLTNIAETLGDIRAYPPLFPAPFDGIHLVSFLVRPPVPAPPPGPRSLGPAHLECSYSFTTNKACGVQVQQSLSDPNAVEVILALNSVGYPSLPQPPSSMVKYKIDNLVHQIPADLGTLTRIIVDLIKAYQSRLGLSEADLYVRTYNPLPAPDVSTHVVPFTPLNNLPRSSVNPDDTQPFPIIGWLKVKWAWSRGNVKWEWSRGNRVWGAGWEDRGGAITGPLTAVSWAPDRLDIFGVDANGHVQHMWYDPTLPNTVNGWGAGWEDRGGAITGPLTAVSWAPDRLDIFGVDANGHVQHMWYDPTLPNTVNGWGAGWEDRGGAITGPLTAVSWAPDRLDIFGVDANGHVQHMWYDPTLPNTVNGWGAGWEDRGGAITGPLTAVSWAPDRLDIFGVDANGHVQHMWYDPTLPNTVNGWGAGWEDRGGAITGPLTAVSWAPDRLDIFGVDANGHVQHMWYDPTLPNTVNGWGAGWEDRGGAITGPLTAVSWAPDRLDIFGVDANGHVQHMWYDPTLPNTVNGWGAGWEDRGGAITGPLTAVSWAPDRLDIFGVAQSRLSHLWYG